MGHDICHSYPREAKVRISFHKYAKLCKGIQKYAKVCKSMQSVHKYENVLKMYGKIYYNAKLCKRI